MHFQTSQMKGQSLAPIVATLALVFAAATPMALAQSPYDQLADMPFKEGYIAKGNAPTLLDDLFFQRATQTYLWALPAPFARPKSISFTSRVPARFATAITLPGLMSRWISR
jgi:hypothetical protein